MSTAWIIGLVAGVLCVVSISVCALLVFRRGYISGARDMWLYQNDFAAELEYPEHDKCDLIDDEMREQFEGEQDEDVDDEFFDDEDEREERGKVSRYGFDTPEHRNGPRA